MTMGLDEIKAWGAWQYWYTATDMVYHAINVLEEHAAEHMEWAEYAKQINKYCLSLLVKEMKYCASQRSTALCSLLRVRDWIE